MTHLPITHINEGCVVVCLQQLEVEEFAIKEKPGTAHRCWHWCTTHIIGSQSNFHTSHKQRSKLNSSRHNIWELKGHKQKAVH